MSHLSAMAIAMGPSFELPADIIPAESEEPTEGGVAASTVRAEVERDVAVKAASSCGLCEEGAADFEEYLREQGF